MNKLYMNKEVVVSKVGVLSSESNELHISRTEEEMEISRGSVLHPLVALIVTKSLKQNCSLDTSKQGNLTSNSTSNKGL